MKFQLTAAIAALVLTGCVTLKMDDPKPGQYANYREVAYDRSTVFQLQGIPEPLMHQVQVCAVDVTLDYMTPAEVTRWDAYARGETKLPDSTWRDYNSELAKRMGNDAIPAMQKKCPDTMAELAKYKA